MVQTYSLFLSPLPRMSIYDRHIIARLLKGYFALVGGLILFFIVLHYVEYVDDFLDRGATMRDVFLVYYPNYVPEIVRLISPLALYLAAVFLTGRLAQRLELSSLQTSGVRLGRLMLPYLAVGVVLTGAMFWMGGWVVPTTNTTRLAFEQEYTKSGARRLEYANIHRQNKPGSMLSVNFYEPTSQTATSVTLEQFSDDQRLLSRIDAPRMSWVDSLHLWRLYDPTIRTFAASGVETRKNVSLLDTLLTLQPRDLARSQGDVDAMTLPEAREYIETLKRTGANRVGHPQVAYFSRFSYPLAHLILLLLAVPMASVRRRGGQAVQIGLGLFIAFSYLAVMKLTEPFGYSEMISPLAAAWLPHVLFLAAALILLARTRT